MTSPFSARDRRTVHRTDPSVSTSSIGSRCRSPLRSVPMPFVRLAIDGRTNSLHRRSPVRRPARPCVPRPSRSARMVRRGLSRSRRIGFRRELVIALRRTGQESRTVAQGRLPSAATVPTARLGSLRRSTQRRRHRRTPPSRVLPHRGQLTCPDRKTSREF